jgi:ribonucleoside-diphosphate reductase alpha chain
LLPTDSERTFVCCLSSLNIEKYDEWKDTNIVEDLIRFLDNVLQSFIETAPDSLRKAKYSASRERAVGLGTLGWHGYLQSKGVAFESGGFNSAIQHTNIVYSLIAKRAEAESRKLAVERGEPEDMKGTGLRNSRTTAIAPNANSADLLDTSPSIEPYFRNVFLKSTRAGNFKVKNRHLQRVLQGYGKDTDEVWDAILADEGRVGKLDFLSDDEKLRYKTAMEMDMHWVIEQADVRAKALGPGFQSQSLNVFFPFGSSRKYVNSVHMKFLKSESATTMYYYRSEREGNSDNAKAIERKALVDWTGEECVACSG